jgi:hypothetical protein
MNALGTLILAVLLFVVLFGSRRSALLGMMAGVMFLTQNSNIDIGGFNCFPTRFLELAGFIRVAARREFSFHQLNKIDRALLLLYFYTTVVFLLRSTEGQAYQIGTTLDVFLCYFTFRGLLSDMEDFRWFLGAFVILLAPYALLVLVESMTGHNPFAVIGGVDGGSAWMRNGRPRCFGSFRQPDTLGMFAASFIPLFIGLAAATREPRRPLIGIGLCVIIVWAANSGGAAGAAATGLACWGFWLFRTEMRKVRWAIVGVIILLALVMKAPIWYIFAHISSITGGDGWHRSYLLDVSFQHLGKWWLAGIPITETSGWFPYDLATTGGADITNQFVAFGLTAGLGALALFLFLLTRTFSQLGGAMAVVRFNSQRSDANEFLLWGLGVMLVVHVMDWFGITYFDQMNVVWYMQLAVISGLSQKFAATEPGSLKESDEPRAEVDETSQIPARSAV